MSRKPIRARDWCEAVLRRCLLQHRRNHETFELVRVSVDERPDLAERFGVETLPTLCVVQGRRLQRSGLPPRPVAES